MSRAARLAAHHWYIPAHAAILFGVWLLARAPAFVAEGGEIALLADLCVTAPVLYLLCYARRQPARVSAVRALAIACSGLWLASWLIPASEQAILPQLAPVRWVGLAGLLLIEAWLMRAVLRIAFSGEGSAKEIRDVSGAPDWIARLMLLEARFWRAVWRVVRGDKP